MANRCAIDRCNIVASNLTTIEEITGIETKTIDDPLYFCSGYILNMTEIYLSYKPLEKKHQRWIESTVLIASIIGIISYYVPGSK